MKGFKTNQRVLCVCLHSCCCCSSRTVGLWEEAGASAEPLCPSLQCSGQAGPGAEHLQSAVVLLETSLALQGLGSSCGHFNIWLLQPVTGKALSSNWLLCLGS